MKKLEELPFADLYAMFQYTDRIFTQFNNKLIDLGQKSPLTGEDEINYPKVAEQTGVWAKRATNLSIELAKRIGDVAD